MKTPISRTQFMRQLGGAFGLVGMAGIFTRTVAAQGTAPEIVDGTRVGDQIPLPGGRGHKWPHLANGLSERRRNYDDHGHNPERVYAEMWEAYCTPSAGVNGGYSSLELILDSGGDDRPGISGTSCNLFGRWPDEITLRDSEVAARLIQWLGTNCGLGPQRCG